MSRSNTLEYIYKAVDRMSSTVKRISKHQKALNKNIKKTTVSIKKFGKGMADAGKGGMAKLTAAMGAFGLMSVVSAAKMETMEVAFESMLGSGDKAKAMMKDLTDFTAKTPFQLEGVGKSAKQLLAYGVTTKEMMPTLKRLGDISAGANVPLTDIAQIFGKAKSKGKLMTEELLQLSERGIPIIDLLASRFKVTKSAIFEAASKSQISFGMMEEAFGTLTSKGGIFYDQMNKQSKTMTGVFSTLKDNVNLALAAIGEMIGETFDLKGIQNSVIQGLQKFIIMFKSFTTEHPKLTKFIFILAAVIAMIAPVLFAVGSLISMFASVAFVAGLAGTTLAAIAAPIGIAVAAVIGLIAIGTALALNWETITGSVGGNIFGLSQEMQDFFSGVSLIAKAAFDPILEVVDDLMDKFKMMFNFIAEGVAGMAKNITSLLPNVSEIFSPVGGFFGGIFENVANIGKQSRLATAPSAPVKQLAGQNSKADINVKVSAASGSKIESVETKSNGNTNLGVAPA